jgi:hypothetical protein
MVMDTTLLKLIDGARVKNHLGLRMDEGIEPVKGKNYLHMDIPVRIPADSVVKRGQHVFIEAAGTINVKGRNVAEVEANPALAEYGQVQPTRKVHPDSGLIQLGVWFTAHKQLDLKDLEYCVRLYMYA